jgi:hypothetical protein
MGFIPIGREEVPVGVRASSEFASTCPSSAAVMRLILDPRFTLSSSRKVTSP